MIRGLVGKIFALLEASRSSTVIAAVLVLAGSILTVGGEVRGHSEPQSVDDRALDPRASLFPPLLGAPCPRTDFVGATLDPVVKPTGHNWTRVTLHLNDLNQPCPGENEEKQLFSYSFRFESTNPLYEEIWYRLTLRKNLTSDGMKIIFWQEHGTPTATCGGAGCFEISEENDTLSFLVTHGPPFPDARFVSEMWICHEKSCRGGGAVAPYGDRMPDRGSTSFWTAS